MNKQAKSIFDKLCFDLPQVTRDEILYLRNEFAKQVEQPDNSLKNIFKLNRKFIEGLVYGATHLDKEHEIEGQLFKPASIVQSDANKNNKILTLPQAFSSLSVIIFIVLYEKLITADRNMLFQYLKEYIIPQQDVEEKVFEITAPNPLNNETNNDNIVDEDPDDLVLEALDDDFIIETVTPITKEDTKLNEEDIKNKLMDMIQLVTYQALSNEETWTTENVSDKIYKIIGTLQTINNEKKESIVISISHKLIAHFMFILRDRMAYKPDMISLILPNILQILNITQNLKKNQDTFEEQILLNILSNLCIENSKIDKASKQELWNILQQNIAFISKRMDIVTTAFLEKQLSKEQENRYYNELIALLHVLNFFIDKGSKNEASTLLQTGIFRNLLQLFLKQPIEFFDIHQFLLRACSFSPELTIFLYQVPPFMSLLTQNANFATKYIALQTLWFLLFSLHVPELSKDTKFTSKLDIGLGKLTDNVKERFREPQFLKDITLFLQLLKYIKTSDNKTLITQSRYPVIIKLKAFNNEIKETISAFNANVDATEKIETEKIPEEESEKRHNENITDIKRRLTIVQSLFKDLFGEASKKD